MLLTKERILEEISKGTIHISPLSEELISINSIDVCLGPDMWVHTEKDALRDLYSPDSSLWVKKPTQTLREMIDSNIVGEDFASNFKSDRTEFLTLSGGRFYLGTTLEEVGTKNISDQYSLVPEIRAKSTVGRHGLTVALCASQGEVGYHDRWALEIRVASSGVVPIAVGTPIAKVSFMLASPTKEKYHGYRDKMSSQESMFLPKALKIGPHKQEK